MTKLADTLKLDEIYKQIGEIGPYQYFIIALAGLCTFVPSIVGYSFSFAAATPDFRCKLPGYANDTFQIQSDHHRQLVDYYIPPPGKNTLKNKYDSCHLKHYFNNETSFVNKSSTLVTCNEWVYSTEYFDETLISRVS